MSKIQNRFQRSAFALLLFSAVLLSACGAASGAKKVPEESAGQAAELEVHFFDAGKADAILLTTKNSAALIDAGGKGLRQDHSGLSGGKGHPADRLPHHHAL